MRNKTFLLAELAVPLPQRVHRQRYGRSLESFIAGTFARIRRECCNIAEIDWDKDKSLGLGRLLRNISQILKANPILIERATWYEIYTGTIPPRPILGLHGQQNWDEHLLELGLDQIAMENRPVAGRMLTVAELIRYPEPQSAWPMAIRHLEGVVNHQIKKPIRLMIVTGCPVTWFSDKRFHQHGENHLVAEYSYIFGGIRESPIDIG